VKLVEYTSLEEKEEFFYNGKVKINVNLELFFEKIEEFQTNGTSYIYRGCNEAKYRMYNSAQRIYITQELHKQVPENKISEHYNKFITESIESCKNWYGNVVKLLFKSFGIDENNSIAYLSYMQHFGVPTPLIDFTFNPYVALFIAIDNISLDPSENEIDNYFSLYYAFSDARAFKIWQTVFDTNLKDQVVSYDAIAENDMSIILPDNESYKVINSANIINQEGLFIFNNHPWYPLERRYNGYAAIMKRDMGNEKFEKLLIHDKVAGCFNIHKSLIPAIKNQLNKKGITKDYVFPNMMDFKEIVSNEGILNSLTLKKIDGTIQ